MKNLWSNTPLNVVCVNIFWLHKKYASCVFWKLRQKWEFLVCLRVKDSQLTSSMLTGMAEIYILFIYMIVGDTLQKLLNSIHYVRSSDFLKITLSMMIFSNFEIWLLCKFWPKKFHMKKIIFWYWMNQIARNFQVCFCWNMSISELSFIQIVPHLKGQLTILVIMTK